MLRIRVKCYHNRKYLVFPRLYHILRCKTLTRGLNMKSMANTATATKFRWFYVTFKSAMATIF